MFVDGGDPLDVPVESLADLPAKEDPEGTGNYYMKQWFYRAFHMRCSVF